MFATRGPKRSTASSDNDSEAICIDTNSKTCEGYTVCEEWASKQKHTPLPSTTVPVLHLARDATRERFTTGSHPQCMATTRNSHTDKQKTKSRAAACCGKLCELYMASYSQNVTAVRGQSPSKPMSNSSSEFMCTTCSCISYVFMSSHAFYEPFGMAFVSRVLRLLGGLARFTTHKQSRELTWACAEQRPPLFAHAGHRASEQTLQQYP